jgi:glutaconate CoA-transferase subunit B
MLGFDREARRLELVSYHAGQSVESVRAATGFDLPVRTGAGETPVPTTQELELLRGPVYEEMTRTHPGFVTAQRAGA